MSTVQFVGAPEQRPSGAGGRGDEVWSDIELPGWEEFTGARDRFFASLRRAHQELGRASNEVDAPETSDPTAENPQ